MNPTEALGQYILATEAARQAAFDRDSHIRRLIASLEWSLKSPQAAVDFNVTFDADGAQAALDAARDAAAALIKHIDQSIEAGAVCNRPGLTAWRAFDWPNATPATPATVATPAPEPTAAIAPARAPTEIKADEELIP
jgi:hypothetical protein